MTDPIGIDTSVSIPLLVRTHSAHDEVVEWWGGRALALSGHALVETYSVLTRLPGDVRLGSSDAAKLIRERFVAPLILARSAHVRLPEIMARAGIAGGAVYDALVGLAAARAGCMLATRDARATNTYQAVGADVIIVG